MVKENSKNNLSKLKTYRHAWKERATSVRTHRQALLAHVTRTYHEESTNVSIVSVQRSAFPPHAGQAHSTHSRIVESGVPSAPVSFKLWLISGSTTGKSASGMGTSPHLLQVTIGIGVPQYRCREINQSRNLVTSIIMSHRNGARQHILDSRVQWRGERDIEDAGGDTADPITGWP